MRAISIPRTSGRRHEVDDDESRSGLRGDRLDGADDRRPLERRLRRVGRTAPRSSAASRRATGWWRRRRGSAATTIAPSG